MMAQLSDMSQNAEPTPFHRLLRALDDRGRLLRVYTQNIDAIEQKSGLTFGVPDVEPKKPRAKSKDSDQPEASTSRTPETPRCIPLHGTLQSMHCQICSHSFPLVDHLPSLASGQPPPCPTCSQSEENRARDGKRPRGIGRLRPSVVLYNEAHSNGEGVGSVVQRDLIGGKGRAGADFLLVVGTSLRIPGTKRMVREFAKAVRVRAGGSSSGLSTPSDRSSPVEEDAPPPPVKAVYLNLDFPTSREWEGVFDAWVQGDAQTFADMVKEEIQKEARAKEAAAERKRKREEEAANANVEDSDDMEDSDLDIDGDVEMAPLPTPQSTPKKRSTTKTSSNAPSNAKRRKPIMLKVPVLPSSKPRPPTIAVDADDCRSPHTPQKTSPCTSQLASPPRTPPALSASPSNFRSWFGARPSVTLDPFSVGRITRARSPSGSFKEIHSAPISNYRVDSWSNLVEISAIRSTLKIEEGGEVRAGSFIGAVGMKCGSRSRSFSIQG
mgnify:CR=1 FL=1